MTRRKHPGKPHKRDKGQFVAIPYAMLRHAAFMALSPDAIRILLQIHLGFHDMPDCLSFELTALA
jgi:hypothetical protein